MIDKLKLLDLFSGRLDKAGLGQLGNAVVPQIPEMIGRAIAAQLSVIPG